MSNRFNGFTPDEICMITSKTEPVKKSNGGTVRKHAVNKFNGDTKTTEKLNKHDVHKNGAKDATSAKDTSHLSESTVQALQDALHYQRLDNNANRRQSIPSESNSSLLETESNGNDDGDDHSEQQSTAATKQNNNYVFNDVNDDTRLFQGISLKDFEKHQQMMKEANQEKRQLLSQALERRFEQSIAEATKIAKIREELDKLDQELAADVEILRKEIETVTLQYAYTRENYHQIESQFLAAKLNLHQVSEKKEMLTEHLCTIISHNEDRKAKKLSELLDKVGIDAERNDSPIENISSTQ